MFSYEGMTFDGDTEREAREDELGAEYGDPRRCPKHPTIATSSRDGMFDAPCGACEYECDSADDTDEEATAPTERAPVVIVIIEPKEDDDIPF